MSDQDVNKISRSSSSLSTKIIAITLVAMFAGMFVPIVPNYCPGCREAPVESTWTGDSKINESYGERRANVENGESVCRYVKDGCHGGYIFTTVWFYANESGAILKK